MVVVAQDVQLSEVNKGDGIDVGCYVAEKFHALFSIIDGYIGSLSEMVTGFFY